MEVETAGGGHFTYSMIRPAGGHWRATAHRLPLWIAEAEAELASVLEVQELYV